MKNRRTEYQSFGYSSRRRFLGNISMFGTGLFLGLPGVRSEVVGTEGFSPEEEPLHNWSDWEKFRNTISHPCLTIKPEDIKNSQINIRKHKWASEYAAGVERNAERYLHLMNEEFITAMIEEIFRIMYFTVLIRSVRLKEGGCVRSMT
jgi:hypothetical protein